MAANDVNGGDKTVYILGIDIGTTSVKAALISADTGLVVKTVSRETKAEVNSDLGSKGNEQDVQRIVTSLQFCVSSLPKEKQMRVICVGVSGQMHGVMMWNGCNSWQQHKYGRYESIDTSLLYTWQDERCSYDFISTLPPPTSHLRLASGHGCATLFWLQKHQPELLQKYTCAGTIQDYVVCMLTDRPKPLMSVQNAASWGYFNTQTHTWDLQALENAGFPVQFLPEVKPACTLAGYIPREWYSVKADTLVMTALGDLQCSILASVQNRQDAG